MVAPFLRALPPFAPRPALAIVALALAGFVVDLFVRPVSAEGFLLILLAASPFLIELLRPARPAAAVAVPVTVEAPPRPASQAAQRSPAPAPRAAQERPVNAPPRPAAARPPERQPAPPVRSAPRPPQQPDPSRAANQRPAPRRDEADRFNPREPAKLL